MRDGVEIIDAQVHCWQRLAKPHWSPSYRGANQAHLSIEMVLAAMDAVGVDGAIVDYLSDAQGGSWRDNGYAEDAVRRFPGTLACVVRVGDPRADGLADSIARIRSTPGVVGVRTSVASDEQEQAFGAGAYNELLRAAERHRLPVLLYVSGRLGVVEQVARDFGELDVLVVHLGLPQTPRVRDEPPFVRLPQLLELARYPNVSVQLIGGPALSTEAYPFLDLWRHLEPVLEAFSVDRVMWGSDFTRFWGLHTYAELVDYLWSWDELGRGDKEKLFGGTLRRILSWHTREPADPERHEVRS